MLVVMKPSATEAQVDAVVEKIRSLGFLPHAIPGAQRTAIGITGNKGGLDPSLFEGMPGVREAIRVSQPFKLVSREVKEEDTVVDVGGVEIGGQRLVVMAGPCSVESKEQVLEAARAVKAAGATMLRGGAYKPRTSPYEFQGMAEDGLKLLALARQASGQLWITGLGVSDDGAAIDLEGRMTDSSVLTDYLRRLNAEPRFNGRPFAQLTLRGVDSNGAALPYTEFALRSTPAAGSGSTP